MNKLAVVSTNFQRVSKKALNKSAEKNALPVFYSDRANVFASDYKFFENDKLADTFNKNNLSALDNYAAHKGVNIFVSPVEGSEKDVNFCVVKDASHYKDIKMQLKEGSKAFGEFLRELYVKVEDAVKSM